MTWTCYHNDFIIRPITPNDNPSIAAIIRTVSAEYGLTQDKGYGVSDPHLDNLSQAYSSNNACYWVVSKRATHNHNQIHNPNNQRILGGGGIAPLKGNPRIAELQKMYFLPELRNLGLAKKLSKMTFDFAIRHGFNQCYLETTACLKQALSLYRSLGFVHIDKHLGNTGHHDCEIPMLKNLE